MRGPKWGSGRRRRDLWPWLSLLPFGFGAWAPVVAGVRRRVWWWIALGVLWSALLIASFVITGVAQGHESRQQRSLVGVLIIIAWIGGVVTSFGIRRSYERRQTIPRPPPDPWPVPTESSRRWTARYALIAYLATFFGGIGLALVLRYAFAVKLGVGAGVLFVDGCLLAGLVPLGRRRGLSARDLGIRLTRGPQSIGLVVLAVIAYGVITATWATAFIPHSTAKTLSGDISHLHGINVVVTVIALSASAPIVEEIFFRGLLYRSLRNRLAVVPAALLAGCLFGLVHITSYPLITLPVKAAFGVIACLLYERTGSLLPGIALHSFVDASGVDAALTGNDAVVLICAAAIAGVVALTAGVRSVHQGRESMRASPAPVSGVEPSDVEPVARGVPSD